MKERTLSHNSVPYQQNHPASHHLAANVPISIRSLRAPASKQSDPSNWKAADG